MSEAEVGPNAHENAFEAFAERVTERFGDEIHEIVCFGSVARGEARGVSSDVDVLVVAVDRSLEAELREVAYEVQLEYGVVLSLHVYTIDRFEERRDHPFLRNALSEGVRYDEGAGR